MAKNGFSMSNRVAVEQITENRILTADDCGKHFVVVSAVGTAPGSAIIVLLPSGSLAGDGWNARINIVSGSGAEDVLFATSDNTPNIYWFGVDGSGAGTNATPIESLTFPSGTLVTGDSLDAVKIGSNWFVRSFTDAVLTSSP